MKPLQRVLLGALVLLGLLVGFLALRTRQAPRLPADRDHAAFFRAERCMGCHGPGSVSPRGRSHPIGTDCMRCHAMP